MKTNTKNRKIVLGHNGVKGYEIKKVLELESNGNIIDAYTSREQADVDIDSIDPKLWDEQFKELKDHYKREALLILEEIEALEDIDTQLFGLHCTLEYAITLPYENMRDEVKDAMKHINAIRAEHSENTQEKLDALLAGQQKDEWNKKQS